MSNIKVSPEKMREAATWMDNQKDRMLDAVREAKNKIDNVVDISYDTPKSKEKFAPMWDKYQKDLETGIQARAVRAARRRVFAGVHSKFGAVSFCTFAAVRDVEAIVTDTGLPVAEAQRYSLLGPQVIRV